GRRAAAGTRGEEARRGGRGQRRGLLDGAVAGAERAGAGGERVRGGALHHLRELGRGRRGKLFVQPANRVFVAPAPRVLFVPAAGRASPRAAAALHPDGVLPAHAAGSAFDPGRARRRRALAGAAPGPVCPGLHPLAGRDSPRPQAGQHLLRRPRRRATGRLWPGQALWRGHGSGRRAGRERWERWERRERRERWGQGLGVPGAARLRLASSSGGRAHHGRGHAVLHLPRDCRRLARLRRAGGPVLSGRRRAGALGWLPHGHGARAFAAPAARAGGASRGAGDGAARGVSAHPLADVSEARGSSHGQGSAGQQPSPARRQPGARLGRPALPSRGARGAGAGARRPLCAGRRGGRRGRRGRRGVGARGAPWKNDRGWSDQDPRDQDPG
ncbi:hypothetical protein H632_c3638p0, partial [Helicosporidium sp. ATCC 50920]